MVTCGEVFEKIHFFNVGQRHWRSLSSTSICALPGLLCIVPAETHSNEGSTGHTISVRARRAQRQAD